MKKMIVTLNVRVPEYMTETLLENFLIGTFSKQESDSMVCIVDFAFANEFREDKGE